MKPLRVFVVLFGLADLVLTIGYYLRLPWATSTWPWPAEPLDFLLISSFLAGATVVILWLGLVGDWGAAAGATMNVGLMNAGAAAYLFHRWHESQPHDAALLRRAIAFTVFAIVNAGVLAWSLRQPIRDGRKIDKFLHVSLTVFTIVLLIASVQLFRQSPTIFPWELEPETSIMFGWLFLGSAVYFGWATIRPSWHNARGQLLAFLAYDLVLILPYALLFPSVQPEHFTSLCIYMAVLVYSTLLAIYYLFINKKTRGWRIVAAPRE